jgi:hypothetical protein
LAHRAKDTNGKPARERDGFGKVAETSYRNIATSATGSDPDDIANLTYRRDFLDRGVVVIHHQRQRALATILAVSNGVLSEHEAGDDANKEQTRSHKADSPFHCINL